MKQYLIQFNIVKYFFSVLIIFQGCSSSQNISTAINPAFSKDKYNKILIPTKYLSQYPEDRTFYDAIEMEFINIGFNVFNSSKIDKILNDEKPSFSGVFDKSTAVELGNLFKADGIVLLDHTRGKDGYTKNASVKLINVKNGETLLIANYTFSYGYYKTPSDIANQLFVDIKKELEKNEK